MQGKSKTSLSDAHMEEAARLFGILSEPSRLYLLRELMGGPRTVTALLAATGMKQGNVSKHLGVLRQARFISRERDGNFVRYSIADERLVVLCELMCQRIQNDARSMASLLG